MRYMGIDYGRKRIGVAISDEVGNFAFPHSVLTANGELISKIKSLCQEQKVGAIVMGESKDFHQKDNPIMKAVLAFKLEIEKETALPVYLEPEFMTSAEAEHLQGKNDKLDASAAAIILKSFLEKHRDEIIMKKK